MQLPAALVERLADVRSVGVITGAGVSAESGIATYRGKGGLYDDPEQGERTVAALTGEALRSDPDRTWRVLADLARASRGAVPNAAHHALVEIEAKVERFVLLTQNVDGLHQLAGSRNVIDIHGNVRNTRCLECGARKVLETLEGLDGAPRCANCGGVLRPDVVLFGEMLPPAKVARMHAELASAPPDLLIAAGTTALFPYIAEPVVAAALMGTLTIEVNPESTLLTDEVTFSLRARAAEALPLLAASIPRTR
jgi:NAD-dependent deacetylase